MRAYLDTNVYVSALLRPEGPPGHILRRAYESRFELVLSSALLDELRRALAYRKLRAYLRVPPRDLARWVDGLGVLGDVVDPIGRVAPVSRDPADDVHLAAAAAGRADALVTGDRDLLVLGNVDEIEIVTPSRFLTRLGG